MKKVFFLVMAAIVAVASMSAIMADPAMNNARSSTFMVDDPNGTYTGTCYNVNMNGDTAIAPVSGVQFVVKPEGGTVYRFDGDVDINIGGTIPVRHVIRFNNLQFNVNPSTGAITYISGNGTVEVWVDNIYVGEYEFYVCALTGAFSGNNLNFHFEANVPLFYIADFHASFDYCGTKQ